MSTKFRFLLNQEEISNSTLKIKDKTIGKFLEWANFNSESNLSEDFQTNKKGYALKFSYKNQILNEIPSETQCDTIKNLKI